MLEYNLKLFGCFLLLVNGIYNSNFLVAFFCWQMAIHVDDRLS